MYSKVNSNAISRLARWLRKANELAMRRHFGRSTGCRRRVFFFFWGGGEGALRVRALQATGMTKLIPTV